MPLLEREHLLLLLTEYAAEARAGSGRLVLVVGEAGAGKTALVDAAQPRIGGRWLRTACEGLFTPRPLGPLFDLAALVGGDLLDAARRRAPREELFGRALAALDDPAEPLTVLVIEDLHWADEATLDLLRLLGRRLRDLRVLVVATLRDDQSRRDSPLRIAIGDLASAAGTRRLSVPPLSAAAVAELAKQAGTARLVGSVEPIHDGAPDPAELHRLTGGNAFLVVEAIQSWPLAAGAAPASVRDAVLARTARLGERTRPVLEVATLLGPVVETDIVQAVVERLGTDGAVEPALDDLVGAGVLVTEERMLRHRHELTRLAVEAEIPAHRRVAVHGAIVGVLLSRGEADPARLAHHADGAGDSEVVLQHAPRAARRSSRLAAHHEAAIEFERALRHATGAPRHVRAGLLHELAIELTFIDHWPDAERAHEEALDEWCHLGDVRRQGDELWRVSRLQGSADVARTIAQRAVDLLDPLGPTEELAWSWAMVAATQMQAGDAAAALDACRRAETLANVLDLPAVRSSALNTEACVESALGQSQWAGRLERALHVALDAGDAMQAARAYTNLVGLHSGRCDFAAAERWYLEGAAYCDDHDIGTYGNCIRGYRAMSLVPQGRWDEALSVAADILRSSRSAANRAEALWTMATVLIRRGHPVAAATVTQLHDEAVRSGSGYWVIAADLVRAEAHWLAGDEAAARAALPPLQAERSLADAWERAHLRAWWARITGHGVTVPENAPLPYACLLAGDVSAAVAAWDQLRCPYDAALALIDGGSRAGNHAEQLLRDALARLEALGADATADVVRATMRAQGIRRVPGRPRTVTQSHPLGLTRREHDVLELLAEGHSNTEISERLFISPKTVDHHVSAVLAKLGVGSRGAAVAKAQRSGVLPTSR